MTVLTPEQRSIIEHDLKSHATVLAVAGSGKTTTMVHRIRYLVTHGVPDRAIRAVMYNASAREDFAAKLSAAQLSSVKVQTFHAMGNGILEWAQKRQYLTKRTLVTADRDVFELIRAAIRIVRDQEDTDRPLDTDDAKAAISTWKAMLTPPEEALHLVEPLYVPVYREFERLRRKQSLITFDDQIYDAVALLRANKTVRERMVNKLEHLIIDEFQDVNHARLKLAQILAGNRAKVMVVGDDDQCIYEWQGARSAYIKRGFQRSFTHHPHASYKLSRSFRFGPVIAQVAANTIAHNTDRVDKALVASDLRKPGEVTLDAAGGAGGTRQALPRIRTLLRSGALPSEIVVLVRKYSQSFLIQSLLLAHRIPFFVEGERPLKTIYPVKLAARYLAVVARYESPVTRLVAEDLKHIVQRPSGFVSKVAFGNVVSTIERQRSTVEHLLGDRNLHESSGVKRGGLDHLQKLGESLREAATPRSRPHTAGHALAVLLDRIDFRGFFAGYEGDSAVDDDVAIMHSVALLLKEAEVPLGAVDDFLDKLDPSQGRPDRECVRITSVFKAKGLEWDHVLLPDLIEGQCPDLRAAVDVCANKADPGRSMDPTQTIESERRLFYVAVTRARQTVHLFADPAPRRYLSRFVHEACLKPTRDAISALHGVLGGNAGQRGPLRTAASSDAHLREGLLSMLRLAANEEPASLQHSIERATAALNKLNPAPFAYPHAYAEVSNSTVGHEDTGLPF